MKRIKTIAFDVQGTLVNTLDKEDSLAMQLLLKRLKKADYKIIVWTSDTAKHAQKIIKDIHLEDYVDEYWSKLDKNKPVPDLAFDDVSYFLPNSLCIIC